MKLVNAFTLTSDQDKISTYNIKQTSVEGKKQFKDYLLIQYQIHRTKGLRIAWQTLWRITNENLGEKGLRAITLLS